MKMKTSLAAFFVLHSLGLAAAAVTTGTTSVMQMKKSRFVSSGFVRAIMILIIVSFVSGISAEMDNQVHMAFDDAFKTKEGEKHEDPKSMKATSPMINAQEVDQVDMGTNFIETQYAQFPASSCNGIGACQCVSGSIGANSCNGANACTYLSGTVRENSCNADYACNGAGKGVIESNSCNRHGACRNTYGANIGKGSCNGYNSCQDRPVGYDVPDNHCNYGYWDCGRNRQVTTPWPTFTPWPTTPKPTTPKPIAPPPPAPSPSSAHISEWQHAVDAVQIELTKDVSADCRLKTYDVALNALIRHGSHFFLTATASSNNPVDAPECPKVIAFASVYGEKAAYLVKKKKMMNDYTHNHYLGKATLEKIIDAESVVEPVDDSKYDLTKNSCVHYAGSIWRELGFHETNELATFLVQNLIENGGFINVAREKVKVGGLRVLATYMAGGDIVFEKYVNDTVFSQLNIE